MAKIHAPNPDYTGISASVPFAGGVGETENPALLEWFAAHGYGVEPPEPVPPELPEEPPEPAPPELTGEPPAPEPEKEEQSIEPQNAAPPEKKEGRSNDKNGK